MSRLSAVIGILVFIALAWLISMDRRRFPLRQVIGALILQWVLALLILKTEVGRRVFEGLAWAVTRLLHFSDAGAGFLFGPLVDDNQSWGFLFAFRVLPTIIFFSSLTTIGYHLGILQKAVGLMAAIMRRSLRISGAEALCAAANMFTGQTEAPLTIRPYIAPMTRSELFNIMAVGFATVSGSAMAAYLIILGKADAAHQVLFAKHLLAASVMSAPAGVMMAKIILPETAVPQTAGTSRLRVEPHTINVVDAAATGATDGLKLALNVGAMLIAFIAIITMLDAGLGQIGRLPGISDALAAAGVKTLSLKGMLGTIFWPIAFLIGIPTPDCHAFGSLLGEAMAANEFVAYISLADMIRQGQISERTTQMACYALCGFANFASIAIQIAGIGGMAPDRRHELAGFGLRAMAAGALACWSTGAIAGLLI
ncbi:MAG TPA: nucleoside transporter C-terminal domain-containing protein [Phycisphaerae bacterium]|nr:nucleoside transporter C-terminal domain-containing protein [Phycisphaerae bacterium]